MRIQIDEIIGRSTQGITKPFICRGDDGHIYFVKGRGAGRRSLICEWVAGSLGVRLGLPVAPFAIVEVPDALIRLGSRDDLGELGAGPAFGSRKLAVVELSISHLLHVPGEMQRAVLAFDWWVRNEDRTLSAAGGNPNLFWDVDGETLAIIDHNQAFDPNFSIANFVRLHAFHGQIDVLRGDWVTQQQYCARFDNAMAEWALICNTIPSEWWFIDSECTLPVDFDLASIHQQLLNCQDDAFWKVMK